MGRPSAGPEILSASSMPPPPPYALLNQQPTLPFLDRGHVPSICARKNTEGTFGGKAPSQGVA